MTAATPFPTPWGYDQIVGGNSTDIFNASLAVWRESGANGIALDFTIGMLPLLLAAVIYVRTKKIAPSLFVAELCTILLHVFDLMSDTTARIFYILFGVGLALSIGYWLLNKN